MSVRNISKSILPLPAKGQREEFANIKAKLKEQKEQTTQQLKKQEKAIDENKKQLEILAEALNKLQEIIVRNHVEYTNREAAILKEVGLLKEEVSKFADTENKNINSLRKVTEEIRRNSVEAVWAEIFNNTIKGSTWGSDISYSPGRWAVGYPYLYVMYRVLNEARPKKILELGLGHSTRMLGQYAATHEGVEHTVVEHDQEWIDFCRNNFSLSSNSQIIRLDREFIPYKEAEAVRVFKGFKEKFEGRKFDFISIDAPLGADMKKYSRIDVLQMMPDILSENFVIMIDDLDRKQEQNTANEMIEVLKNNGIIFKTGKYGGNKDCMIICANQLGFLASL